MFRTSRTVRRGLTWMGEWRLPSPDRRAARSARAVERQMHRERDNQDSNERRLAALQAEQRGSGGGGG
jgi:hypothetical protein